MVYHYNPGALYLVQQQGIGAAHIAGGAGEVPGTDDEVIIGGEFLNTYNGSGELTHVGLIRICFAVPLQGGIVAIVGAILTNEYKAIVLPIAVHVASHIALVPFLYLGGEHGTDGGFVVWTGVGGVEGEDGYKQQDVSHSVEIIQHNIGNIF